jgi:alpha 1,3-mannosyltransferase
MPFSSLRCPFVPPRRTALLVLLFFIFGTLMLRTSLYLYRTTLSNTSICYQHEDLTQVFQHNYVGRWGERPIATSVVSDDEFEVALRNLTDLTPDEARAKQLLSPIDISQGTSMLRDLAIRTRFFGVLLTAWESLHIVRSATPDNVLIRQNIVDCIRHGSLEGRGEAIRRYDSVRSFMNQFSRHLFPWTAGHSADHMLLHTSFAAGGQGIVLTVGDHQIAYVLTSIRTFREFGCDLPVEVFFMGDGDLHEDSRVALEKLPGVTTRDLSKMIYDDGWTLKGKTSMYVAERVS